MRPELLQEIVGLGANVNLESSVTHDQLRTLVGLAAATGAQVTILQSLPPQIIQELAAVGKNHVTFICA